MKFFNIILGLVFIISVIVGPVVCGQGVLQKIKNKTEDKFIEKIFESDNKQQDGRDEGSSSGSGSDRPSNTQGGGLNKTSIDVQEQIKNAELAYNSEKYGDAKYAVRQAILGVELEIGENILNDLPASVDGLPKIENEDMVTSSGIGFVGMIIERSYRKSDKHFKVTIGNDAAMLSAVNMYLASGAYAQSSEEENFKQTRYKEHSAVIEYNEYSGYKLSVPFGQSSILVMEGVNFSSEDEFINASSGIDMENIKKQLGEQ